MSQMTVAAFGGLRQFHPRAGQILRWARQKSLRFIRQNFVIHLALSMFCLVALLNPWSLVWTQKAFPERLEENLAVNRRVRCARHERSIIQIIN